MLAATGTVTLAAPSFAPATALLTGQRPAGAAMADFDQDGDGDIDLVTTHQDSNSMSTLENTGASLFLPGVLASAGVRPGNIALGDLDNNGGVDIAIANCDSNNVSLFANLNGSGPCSGADFAEPFGVLDFFDASAFLAAFNTMGPAADLNQDGAFNFFDVSAFLNSYTAGCP